MNIIEKKEVFGIASKDDAVEIASLASTWVEEMGHNVDPLKILKEFEHYLNIGRVFTAKSEGKIVGMFIATIKTPIWNGHQVGNEECVFIDPSYRGKGLIVKFIKLFEEWSKYMGCTEVTFNPSIYGAPKLESFCKFLGRLGYSVTAHELTREI